MPRQKWELFLVKLGMKVKAEYYWDGFTTISTLLCLSAGQYTRALAAQRNPTAATRNPELHFF